MVHAAGNDGADLGEGRELPDADLPAAAARAELDRGGCVVVEGRRQPRGARSRNYGQQQVDVFAPGVDILSTVPGNQYERDSGTSMAAPVVSGLAALLMAYYPSLTASDVKRIIVSSATSYRDQLVVPPEDGSRRGPAAPVRFGDLSVTGGVVNAMAAVKMAQEMTKSVP